VVGPGSRGRADKVLSRALRDQSRVAWQRAFAAGLVTRGGKALDQKDTVRAGEEIAYSFPAVKPAELTPRKIPLEVLLEDRHLLVLNKPARMVVHPGAGTGDDTLVHALLAHCAGKLSGIGGVERPGIVHRLDRETSGAIVVAKTDAAHRGLAAQFAERTVIKEYLALVDGVPELLSGSILKPIGRHPRHRHKMIAGEERQKSFGEDALGDEEEAAEGNRRDAHTDWTVVERFGKRAAVLRCTLHTGRTHQIRVHLKSIGHVLLGDAVYGFKPGPGLPAIPRVMLHSEHLGFVHPVTKKAVEIRAPLPKDFQAVVKALKKGATPIRQQRRSAAAGRGSDEGVASTS
jgi:23S rRNA pseudouridine1911/1915/1917 synthase